MALAVDGDSSGRGFGGGEIHVVEMAAESSSAVDEASPLLAADGAGDERPRMTIFSVSYPRKQPAKVWPYLIPFLSSRLGSFGALEAK